MQGVVAGFRNSDGRIGRIDVGRFGLDERGRRKMLLLVGLMDAIVEL